MSTEPEKKRHHYVPICYLNQFTDSKGRTFAYRKDDPLPPLHVPPSEIAFERYYYSQPLPEGGRDNNSVENFFSTIETTWPPIVDRIINRQDTRLDFEAIAVFLSMLRVRVPAARDLVELSLAEMVKTTTRHLDEAGHLPPKPEGLNLDDIAVSIDPHQSLHAMPSLIQGFGAIIGGLGYEVLHNSSGISFVSSDNPVIYYDPNVPIHELRPYRVRLNQRIELIFPVTKNIVLRGRSDIVGRRYIRHVTLTSKDEVRRINRLVAKFGYRFVFAADETHEQLAKRYAASSPVLRSEVQVNNISEIWQELIFGPRLQKPKWTNPAPYS